MNKIIALVIAGNYKQFMQWAHQYGFDPKEYRYIRDIHQCEGHRDLPILLIGEYYKGVSYKLVTRYVQGGDIIS